jgi:hypothetical protein
MAQQPLVGQGLLIYEVSRPHSDTPHSVGLPWTSDQPDAETTHYAHKKQDIHATGGIQTRNSSKRAPADRATTGAGSRDYRIMKLFVYNNKNVRNRSNCNGKVEGVWRRIVTDLPILNLGIRW